ncbi:MAG: hypothetical protein HN353_10750 [Bdellovibrionales bacterium]|nr:hypothetical protein [Bdellovibrionales bacterium]MBT3524773.1 hypothetical protein [Bdellovibrionales bacterium]MBT7670161.1 hypothetical protein [Bdellovibrionales bacterium]MBT7766088.1 hypothetical protein [Bdellovibrionales bacterium]
MIYKIVFLLLILSSTAIASQWDEIYIDTIPLNSKEYKISLKPEQFNGGKRDVDRFRYLFEKILTPAQLVKSYYGKKRARKKTRYVTFYDTKGECLLKNNGFSLRERTAFEVGERWVNVKYRSRDIEESGDRNVNDHQQRGIQKFEEDLVGIESIYSHSNKVQISDQLDIPQNALTIFPVLGLTGLTNQHQLVKVGNYTVTEYNYVLAKMRFDRRYNKSDSNTKKFKKRSIRKIELALWYIEGRDTPIMAEVTWKIKDKNGNYYQESVQSGNNLFNQLKLLDDWVDPNPEPKTTMIYAHSIGFCNSAATKAAKQDTTILSLVEQIDVNSKGGAHVNTTVMLRGAKDQNVLLPLNFKEAKSVTGSVPIAPVKINGTWFFSIKLDGKSIITYQYDVDRFMDWRIGLDLDGFPNVAVKGHQNVMVKYKFTNTSVHKINNYRLKMRVPPKYAISRIIGVVPKKIKRVDPDRFQLVANGVDVGFTQGEASHETQAFTLPTGAYAGITLLIRPEKKSPWLLILGVGLIILWLAKNRDILK